MDDDKEFLNPFQRLSYQTFYGMAKRSAERNYSLREYLEKGHMPVLAEVYIATMWMATLITAVVGVMAFLLLGFLIIPMLMGAGMADLAPILSLVSLAVLASPLFVFLGFKMWPRMRVKQRASDIEVYLPYAANFVAAMAAANATPQKIFMSLAAQKHIYGEVSDEARWIYRDMTLLGTDLLTALKRAVKRSPSTMWQEFLQGVVGTLTSGGDLKLYFLNRGEYYMIANRREQKSFLDTLAFMAESYVIVAVAMPMFLMIILTITFWISGSGYTQGDSIMYLFSWVAMPVIHFAYITFVRMATPKV